MPESTEPTFATAKKPKRKMPSDWKQKRWFVIRRDGSCQFCGSKKELHCDHLMPVSRGGSDDVENLVAACLYCNLTKKDKTVQEFYHRSIFFQFLVAQGRSSERVMKHLAV